MWRFGLTQRVTAVLLAVALPTALALAGCAGAGQPPAGPIDLGSDYGAFTLVTVKTVRPMGQVLDQNGKAILDVNMINRKDGPWLDLPSLARLFDLLAWGTLTSDGKLLVAAPEIP